MAEKLDRKQLKKPDEFQVVAGRAMAWVAARQKQVVGVLIAVAVAALAIWGVSWYRASRDAKAGAALAEALELQSRPLAGERAAQETFATADEREKAVISALEKVRSQYGNTSAGRTALAELGFHKLKAADAAGAQKDLQDFLASTGSTHPLRPFAQQCLAYALEAQNKLDEARAAFEKLRDLGLPGVADLQAARLALLEGKPDAKQQLEKVAKEYPTDPLVVREANERIELAALPPYNSSDVQAPAKPAAAKAEAGPKTAGKAKK